MHTLKVVAAGLALFAVLLLLTRAFAGSWPGASRVVPYFLGLWLVASVVNLALGVWKAGYSVLDELPILLVVFGVPAAVALLTSKVLVR